MFTDKLDADTLDIKKSTSTFTYHPLRVDYYFSKLKKNVKIMKIFFSSIIISNYTGLILKLLNLTSYLARVSN